MKSTRALLGSLALAVFVLSMSASSPADFLPPAPPWHGASEALIAKPDNPWITPAEKAQLLDSPNYDDTISWLKKLADASPLIEMVPFGKTAQGRTLYVVIATKEKSFTPTALLAGGKPTMLVQAGIHSGEIDGKDAGMMLLRDIAFGGKDALLDHANLLFVPVFNADGHERSSEWNRPNQRGPVHQGWRTTAQNLNLNRDYMKLDAPESQAMVALINTWQPALYLDVHVTDGIDYQYDITYGYNGWDGNFAWSPQIGAWLEHTYRPALDAALKTAGHIPGPLIFATNNRDLNEGIVTAPGNPRFSNPYGDLRHIAAVLIENHSLKPYPQRVLGTYVLLETSLKAAGDNGAALRAAIKTDSAARPEKLALNWAGSVEKTVKMDFLGIAFEEYVSPASGIKEVRWLGTPKTYHDLPVQVNTEPGVRLARPKAYWVPVTKPEVIDRLKRHGIAFTVLDQATTKSVELYRLVDPKAQPGEGFYPYEGRAAMSTSVKSEPHTEIFPAGSVRVSTDQPLGDLAMALLEPQSADSFFAWGFFPELTQRTEYVEGYVIAPLAEKMLADDPKLKTEFEAKLAADEKFAKDPAARLQWFYARSKFYDERYLLYPVGIER